MSRMFPFICYVRLIISVSIALLGRCRIPSALVVFFTAFTQDITIICLTLDLALPFIRLY